MGVDHQTALLWVTHGGEWSAGVGRLIDAASATIARNRRRWQRLAPGIAAIIVSTGFVGVAVLPAWLV